MPDLGTGSCACSAGFYNLNHSVDVRARDRTHRPQRTGYLGAMTIDRCRRPIYIACLAIRNSASGHLQGQSALAASQQLPHLHDCAQPLHSLAADMGFYVPVHSRVFDALIESAEVSL
jgi:hypothetical protein